MSDPVREYLTARKCADFVIRDGLPGLVASWEATVASVAVGEEQCEDDYLNDMDGRHILEEALAAAPPAERSAWSARVRLADVTIRRHLVPTASCIWGEENAVKHGYTRDSDWWYYHRPKVVDASWRTF